MRIITTYIKLTLTSFVVVQAVNMVILPKECSLCDRESSCEFRYKKDAEWIGQRGGIYYIGCCESCEEEALKMLEPLSQWFSDGTTCNIFRTNGQKEEWYVASWFLKCKDGRDELYVRCVNHQRDDDDEPTQLYKNIPIKDFARWNNLVEIESCVGGVIGAIDYRKYLDNDAETRPKSSLVGDLIERGLIHQ